MNKVGEDYENRVAKNKNAKDTESKLTQYE